ncbi:hypothetical protein IW146_000755 [Coemansia sp. RSA 922]|nr:hypothetical protein H4S03_006459 [Coemansia sp. S3946]KAJ2044943.1 hypothetical protein H4S04_005928 [Coemansia sp. S16]KAJ2067094.1 hypothetical protein GGI08_001547 [Coemansia sp. S2]KAJ2117432.1 hypothetical protein IW146_000755 [Coemansia sp. RSA 922]
MPPLSLFQLLPFHIVERIVDHLVASNRLLAEGITADSAEHKILLLPLLWVCRNFRDVSCLKFYRSNTVKVKDDDYEKDVGQYWWSKRLKKFYPSMHHLAREIHILLGKSGFYTGKTLEAFSRAPFDGCAFPQARKLIFTFYPYREPDYVAPEAAKVDANIRAFVQRMKQMAPMVCEIEVVGTSNPVTLPADTQHMNGFLSQVFQLATRVVYKVSEHNVPLELPAVSISHLVHIDMDVSVDTIVTRTQTTPQAQQNATMHLARQNAMTLQSLSIGTYTWENISGLVKGANGDDVAYPQLRVLKLRSGWGNYGHCRPVITNVVPFPQLCHLHIAGPFPFGDDILFRGNADTLKCLDIILDRDMANMLKRHSVFTSISHPRLRCVKIELPLGYVQDDFATDETRLQYLLDIAPAATMREIKGLNSCTWFHSSLPVFGDYTNLQVLVLPDTRLTLWDAITLIELLPLLSEIQNPSPVVGSLPAEVTTDMLPEYVVSKYVSLSKSFRCWRITYEDKWVSRGDTISCVLLLALVCPNFDHAITSSSNSNLFMAHIREAISTNMFLPYASSLQRLLPSKLILEISDVKTI